MIKSNESRSRRSGGGFCFSSCFSSQNGSGDEGQIIDETTNPDEANATQQRKSIKRNKVDVAVADGSGIIDLAQLAAKNDMCNATNFIYFS